MAPGFGSLVAPETKDSLRVQDCNHNGNALDPARLPSSAAAQPFRARTGIPGGDPLRRDPAPARLTLYGELIGCQELDRAAVPNLRLKAASCAELGGYVAFSARAVAATPRWALRYDVHNPDLDATFGTGQACTSYDASYSTLAWLVRCVTPASPA